MMPITARAAAALVAAAACLNAGPALAAPRPVDVAKSEIGFSVKEMGVSVSGSFKRFSATIDLDPAKLEAASAEIKVDVASIDTGSEEGDDTARDKPWLDVGGFPQAVFRSSSVRALGADRYEAKGTLTIRGQPRDVTVPFTLTKQPAGVTVAAGDFRIRRTDFGVGAAQGCASAAGAGCAGAAGGQWDDLVADDIPIHFRLVLGEPR